MLGMGDGSLQVGILERGRNKGGSGCKPDTDSQSTYCGYKLKAEMDHNLMSSKLFLAMASSSHSKRQYCLFCFFNSQSGLSSVSKTSGPSRTSENNLIWR